MIKFYLIVLNILPHNPRKWFQPRQSKSCKKLRKAIFKRPQYWFLSSRKHRNHFLKRFVWPSFDLNNFWCFALLSHRMVSTSTLKIYKNLKTSLSKLSEHSFLISSSLQNLFLKSFLWPALNLIGLQVSALLSQKTVSTLLLKNLQKTEKCPFQTLRTFVLELKVPSKPFSKKLLVTQFWFK